MAPISIPVLECVSPGYGQDLISYQCFSTKRTAVMSSANDGTLPGLQHVKHCDETINTVLAGFCFIIAILAETANQLKQNHAVLLHAMS